MTEQPEVEWEKCEEPGCIGIRLNPARVCLFHASEEERAAALQLVSETEGVIDARGVHITRPILEQILDAAPRGDNSEPVIKSCQFDKAVFGGGIVFSGATFTGAAWFSEATFSDSAAFDNSKFTGDAGFGGAIFSRRAGFREATFSSGAGFREATFRDSAEFDRATFGDNAEFDQAKFTGDAKFSKSRFTSGAAFSGATFSCRADFAEVRFDGSADFAKVRFDGSADFADARFTGGADFAEVRFDGATGFNRARFTRGAVFDRVRFTGDAGFGQTTFSGDARFCEARFTSSADFNDATFNDGGRFDRARFEQARQFGPLQAHRKLVLDEVQFAQPVQIEVTSTGVCCRRARFPGGVHFRLRGARVVLDDTDLAAPSILAGIPRPSRSESACPARSELAWRVEDPAGASEQSLKGEISERPQLVSLRRADVAGLRLSNVSADYCRFAGAHNLDKLRLESDVSFATAPVPVGLGRRSWGGREVIAEERTWRAKRSRRHRRQSQDEDPVPLRAQRVAHDPTNDEPGGALRVAQDVPADHRRNPNNHDHWDDPPWPSWLDDPRPDALDPRQIAGLYRALRKGREEAKDEPGAADYYYGEMEMRRARPSSGSNPACQSGVDRAGTRGARHLDGLLASVRLRPACVAGGGLACCSDRAFRGRVSPGRLRRPATSGLVLDEPAVCVPRHLVPHRQRGHADRMGRPAARRPAPHRPCTARPGRARSPQPRETLSDTVQCIEHAKGSLYAEKPKNSKPAAWSSSGQRNCDRAPGRTRPT